MFSNPSLTESPQAGGGLHVGPVHGTTVDEGGKVVEVLPDDRLGADGLRPVLSSSYSSSSSSFSDLLKGKQVSPLEE